MEGSKRVLNCGHFKSQIRTTKWHSSEFASPAVEVAVLDASHARKDFEIFRLNGSSEESPARVVDLAAVGVVFSGDAATDL